ncbi:hypothetical protein HMPREF9353_00872 [Treponema denticola F0402]|nr:hypothetical protein HMPREF9353_00872 [Treponema denticola F0402]
MQFVNKLLEKTFFANRYLLQKVFMGVLKMNKTMACEDCEAIDEAFGKMGEMQKKIAIKKITEMEESLEKLEDELTDIINTHSNILTEN